MNTLSSRRLFALLAVVIAAVVTAGCSQHSLLDQGEFADRYIQQRDALLAQSDWQLRAKIGIRADGKAHSATLNWQQTADDFRLRMAGPLGMGAVKLSGNSQQVSLEQAGQPPRMAKSAESLLRDSIGIGAPLESISLWLRGLPTKARLQALEVDPGNGSIQSFEQEGWRVSYSRYKQFDGFLLPARIKLEPADRKKRAASYSERSLTVLAHSWQFEP